MYRQNVSGQQLYFGLTSVLSGFAVTGMSGSISGRKSIDGGALTLLSGNIIEVGGGLYQANLYDFDTNGRIVGFVFTCSGAVPTFFNVITEGSVSGNLRIASGQSVNVNSGQLSGQQVALHSGQTTFTYSGSLSGQRVDANVIEWRGKQPRILAGSGHVDAFSVIHSQAVASATANTVQFTTAPNGTSGILNGCIVNITEGTAKGQSRVIRHWGSSGIALIDPPWDAVPDAGTSWGIITPATWVASGTSTLASGSITSGVINSGIFVTATATVASGLSVIATLYSGQEVLVYSGQLSGQPVTLLSGRSWTASGIFTVAEVTVASGLSVIATLYSGQTTLTYSGQLSGQPVTLLSGRSWTASGIFTVAEVTVASGLSVIATLYSGQTTLVYSGQLSGQAVDLLSGRSWLASGNLTAANSGLFVVGTLVSGTNWLASGSINANTFASGVITREIPERVLKVDFSGVQSEASRSLINAARKLMNKWDVDTTNSGYITVFKENDSTQAYKQAITAVSGASPITALDTE